MCIYIYIYTYVYTYTYHVHRSLYYIMLYIIVHTMLHYVISHYTHIVLASCYVILCIHVQYIPARIVSESRSGKRNRNKT